MENRSKDRREQNAYAPEFSAAEEKVAEKDKLAPQKRPFRPVDTHGYIATGGSGQPKVVHTRSDGSRSPILKHGPNPQIKTSSLTKESLEEHPVHLMDRWWPAFLRRTYIRWEGRLAKWREESSKRWNKFMDERRHKA